MRNDDSAEIVAVVVAIMGILGITLGMAIQGCEMSGDIEKMKKEWSSKAVEAGAAYYDPKTGEFTWKEKAEEQ